MNVIIASLLFIAETMAIAMVTVKRTMIDDEGRRDNPGYLHLKDEDDNDVIHPLR